MKKSLIVLCGALSIAAFAEPAAPAPAASGNCECGCLVNAPAGAVCGCPKTSACCGAKKTPKGPACGCKGKAERGPLVLNLDAGTTPDQIDAFKKDVLAKIDAAVASKPAECKCGKEGCKCPKAQKKVIVFVGDGMGMMDRRHGQGMGRRHGQGMGRPQGRRPQGQPGGMRGPMSGMSAPEAAPQAAPEAPAAK